MCWDPNCCFQHSAACFENHQLSFFFPNLLCCYTTNATRRRKELKKWQFLFSSYTSNPLKPQSCPLSVFFFFFFGTWCSSPHQTSVIRYNNYQSSSCQSASTSAQPMISDHLSASFPETLTLEQWIAFMLMDRSCVSWSLLVHCCLFNELWVLGDSPPAPLSAE